MATDDRYTVLIMPDGAHARPRRIEVSGRWVRRVLVALFLVLVGLGGSVTWSLRSAVDTARLRSENAAYKQQIDRAQEMADALAAQLAKLKETEERLREAYGDASTEAASGRGSPGEAMPQSPSQPGGRGGVESGPVDRLSPGFDVMPMSTPSDVTPSPSTDPLMRRFEEIRAELRDTSRSLAMLEKQLRIQNRKERHTPSILPVNGPISSTFGSRVSPFSGSPTFHDGLDVLGDIGDPVVATADGVVTFAGWSNGYGTTVEIDHGNGLKTRYAHNQRALVRAGQTVRRGQTIARLGMTGNTTGPHCHYEVLKRGRQVNPAKYLDDAQ